MADLRAELVDIRRFAEMHHGDEDKAVLLHALLVDIPHRLDLLIDATPLTNLAAEYERLADALIEVTEDPNTFQPTAHADYWRWVAESAVAYIHRDDEPAPNDCHICHRPLTGDDWRTFDDNGRIFGVCGVCISQGDES